MLRTFSGQEAPYPVYTSIRRRGNSLSAPMLSDTTGFISLEAAVTLGTKRCKITGSKCLSSFLDEALNALRKRLANVQQLSDMPFLCLSKGAKDEESIRFL